MTTTKFVEMQVWGFVWKFTAYLPVSCICLNIDLNEMLQFFAGMWRHIKLIYVLDKGVVKSVGGLHFSQGNFSYFSLKWVVIALISVV